VDDGAGDVSLIINSVTKQTLGAFNNQEKYNGALRIS
jgi:hypothetical protein